MLNARRNTALTVALAALASAAVPAAADIATSIQNFQFDENTLAFDGTVSSPNSHCVAGRQVTVTSGDGTTIGTATTDKTGLFSVSDPGAQAGTYTATVAATKVKGKKPKHGKKRPIYNCGAGTTGQQQL
jgi:hypothetical protein